jgi:hypothetical protein
MLTLVMQEHLVSQKMNVSCYTIGREASEQKQGSLQKQYSVSLLDATGQRALVDVDHIPYCSAVLVSKAMLGVQAITAPPGIQHC